MSLTVENKTFITNRSVDQTESKRAMGAGLRNLNSERRQRSYARFLFPDEK